MLRRLVLSFRDLEPERYRETSLPETRREVVVLKIWILFLELEGTTTEPLMLLLLSPPPHQELGFVYRYRFAMTDIVWQGVV